VGESRLSRLPDMSEETFGYQVAMQKSNASTEAEFHPLRQVPIATGDGDKPDAVTP
jgi:hypothetical protein